VLFVGRAFERKGGPQLLAAIAILRKRMDIRLDVVGPPPPPEHERPPGVIFHGPLPPSQTAKLYEQATLFVMPPQFEAYGIALVEALSCGVPCVARAVCAIPEILGDGKWGNMVTSDDPDELARAIQDAIQDETLHSRVAAARDAFRLFYSWDRAALQMLSTMYADKGQHEKAASLNEMVPARPH
jgi:glycosyltransferase involved in cell wall biosynthesis